MQIAVCDDLQNERRRLTEMITEFFEERHIPIQIAEFESGEAFLSAFQKGTFALSFLDIYMGGMNGIETAKTLKEIDPDCAVIFTTTSREHGADAFDIEAFYYLVKPFEKEKLFVVLEKWYNLFCEHKSIQIKCGKTEREVLMKEILYVEVFGRSSTVHTLRETFNSSLSLAVIEKMLPEEEFCRAIRYCLVSLWHIARMEEESILLDHGEKIPLSRRERDKVKEKLADFQLMQLRRR